jgi:hypothetical protein
MAVEQLQPHQRQRHRLFERRGQVDLADALPRPTPDLATQPFETDASLTEGQRITGQIAYSGKLLDRFIDKTLTELPSLRTRNIYTVEGKALPDQDIIVNRVAGLASAYRIIAEMSKNDPTMDAAAMMAQFQKDWPNSDELLTHVRGMAYEIQNDKDEVEAMYDTDSRLGKKYKENPWRQRVLRAKATRVVKKELGSDNLALLYENTDTTQQAEQEKLNAWKKTIAVSALNELLPHVVGGLATVSDIPEQLLNKIPEHLRIGKTAEEVIAAVGLTVFLWWMLYGPVTKGNTDMLMDTGVSLTPLAKGAQENAEGFNNADEETVRKKADLWNRVYQGAGEAWYIGEAVALGITSGSIEPAAEYHAGGVAAGIAKNAVLWGYFRAREEVKKHGGMKEIAKTCKHYYEVCKCHLTIQPISEVTVTLPSIPQEQQIFTQQGVTEAHNSPIQK